MRKRIVCTSLLLLAMLCTAGGCKADTNDTIKEEIVDSFVQMVSGAMDVLETDLERIDKDIIDTQEKILKLEHVVTPALEWAKVKEANVSTYTKGSWVTQADSKWLAANLKNDRYQVTSVKFSALGIGSQYQETSVEIKVSDLDARITKDWESAEVELVNKKEKLEQRREAVISSGMLSVTTLQNVIENFDEWVVNKINKTTFSLSGPGLGIPAEGTWTYYSESSKIVPADKQSQSLKKVLSGGS